MTTEPTVRTRTREGYRHEALFWHGVDELVAGTVPFIADGVSAGEPVLVAVPQQHWRPMRDALGAVADQVEYIDMAELGANPARIIPRWRRFVDEHGSDDQPVRGIGEPIWAGRRQAEVNECQVHEALLNLAIGPDVPLWLRCPYDVGALADDVVEAAQRSHPMLLQQDRYRGSTRYGGMDYVDSVTSTVLPMPRTGLHRLDFGPDNIADPRHAVVRWAIDAGIDVNRADDLALAAHEVAVNSVRHGGGSGVLWSWREGDAFICEVHDGGVLNDPLAGRRRPDDEQPRGRGLWMANQLCDLVQIRSVPQGTVVRLLGWL